MRFMRSDSHGNTWSVLHWRLTEPGGPELSLSRIKNFSQRLEVGSIEFRTTGDEHTLLLLALNLRKQRFARLKTIVDISRLLESQAGNLNWQLLHDEAHAAGICALLRHALQLSTVLLDAPVAQLPDCSRRRSVPHRLLAARVATPGAVLREGRINDRSNAVGGLIPFVSLDNFQTSLHLAYDRLMLPPELASYYRSGATNVYRSRRQYWHDTTQRLFRAARTLSRSG